MTIFIILAILFTATLIYFAVRADYEPPEKPDYVTNIEPPYDPCGCINENYLLTFYNRNGRCFGGVRPVCETHSIEREAQYKVAVIKEKQQQEEHDKKVAAKVEELLKLENK